MNPMTTSTQLRKGGSWLLDETAPGDVFTPEKLTAEHQLMAQTAQEFVDHERLSTRGNWGDLPRGGSQLPMAAMDF